MSVVELLEFPGNVEPQQADVSSGEKLMFLSFLPMYFSTCQMRALLLVHCSSGGAYAATKETSGTSDELSKDHLAVTELDGLVMAARTSAVFVSVGQAMPLASVGEGSAPGRRRLCVSVAPDR